jgi:anti-sigma regulatory factor (Ser/Thr protein kinase)
MSGFGLIVSGNDEPQVGSSSSDTSLTMHERLPATLESVGAARRAIRRFAADLEVDLDGIVLAVSEAVANAVAHAYDAGAPGQVDLSAGASPFELTVTVRDHGRGLAGGNGNPGAGFGLTIIRRIAEHVELADTPHGLVLTMAFRRGGDWSRR